MDEADFSFFRTNKSKGEKVDIVGCSEAARICASNPPAEDYTSHKKVGIALIFNHLVINGEKTRYGTNHDRDCVKSALQLFGFDVRVHNDLKFKDLKATLRDVAKEDHSQNDCLVIVVMTHGSMGEVRASDTTYPVESLWKPFLGNNCRSLINKPKMVFIQACRGGKAELPVSYRPMQSGPQAEYKEAVNYFIPTTADLLVFYSSFEGHTSFRSSVNGSWFIQSLCDCLKDAATRSPEGTEIVRLLIRVSRKVAYEYVSHCEEKELDNSKAMPTIVSTLTKIFYLKVKNETEEIAERNIY